MNRTGFNLVSTQVHSEELVSAAHEDDSARYVAVVRYSRSTTKQIRQIRDVIVSKDNHIKDLIVCTVNHIKDAIASTTKHIRDVIETQQKRLHSEIHTTFSRLLSSSTW